MKSIVHVFGALALLATAAPSAAKADECDHGPVATEYSTEYSPEYSPEYYQAAPVVVRPYYRYNYSYARPYYRDWDRRDAWRRHEAYRRWRMREEWREHHRFRPY